MQHLFNTGDPVLFDPMGGTFLTTKGLIKNRVSVCGFLLPQYRVETKEGVCFSVSENKMQLNPNDEASYCQESRLWASQMETDFIRRYVIVFVKDDHTHFTVHDSYQEAEQVAKQPCQATPIYICLAYIAKAHGEPTTPLQYPPNTQDIRFVWHTVLDVQKDSLFRRQQGGTTVPLMA